MEKILELNEKSSEELCKHLETIDAKNLCSLWEDCVREKPSYASALLNAILRGLSCLANSTADSDSQSKLFFTALTQLQRGELTAKINTEILGVLILETPQLSVKQLSQLSSTLIDSIKSGQYSPGKWLELFPHVVSCISTRTDVPYDGGLVTGEEFHSKTIDDLCSTKWPQSFVASLAAMFKELHLKEQELKFVFEKLFEMMAEMEYDAIPPLVYQLLELSFKGQRQMVLQELIKFFNEEDSKVKDDEEQSDYIESEEVIDVASNRRDELKRCEGTVLLHILFAVRYDHDLGRELVKLLKLYRQLPEKILTSFTLLVASCIASDQTFQQPMFDILKSAITTSYREKILKENSFWIRGMTGDYLDPEEIFEATIKKTVGDWDHVLTGLVEFGFALLDVAKKRILGKEQIIIVRQMCKLGSTILLNVFKENRAIRPTILKQILNNILPSESTSISHYLELLEKTIRMSPQSYIEQMDKVRTVLDYLSFFTASVATRLLESFQPLLKVSPTLRDGTLLVLRKIMFMRQLEPRKIAVSGLLLFLKTFKVIGPFSSSQSFQGSESSQLLVDVHVKGKTSNNEALCLEVLGVLRRSLSQQVDVRVTLYQGLPKVLVQSCYLTDAVLDLLLNQANQYIEAGAMPPLKLKQCIQEQGSEPCLTEPLPFLIKCINSCVGIAMSQHNDEDQEEPWTHPLSILLQDLAKAMLKAELEDFELDKSVDYSTISVLGKKNYLMAIQVVGVYEILIEYTFLSNDYSESMAKEVLSLFENYQKLVATIKEKSSQSKKKDASDGREKGTRGKNTTKADKVTKKKTTTAQTPAVRQTATLLSEHFLVASLKALILDKTPSKHEALSLLRANVDFEAYLINMAVQKIPALDTMENSSTLDESDLFDYCCSIGRLLLLYYTAERVDTNSVLLVCINGFTSSLSVICNRFPTKVEIFLTKLDKDLCRTRPSQSKKELSTPPLEAVIKKFQRLVDSVLDRTRETSNLKLAASLLQTMKILLEKLPNDAQHQQSSSEIMNWMENTLKRETIDDANVLKAVLSVAFQLRRQKATYLDITKELAEDVHKLLGDINEDVKLTNRLHFRTIGKDGAATVVIAVVEELFNCHVNVDWVVTTLKATVLTHDRKDIARKGRQSKQNKLCSCLLAVSATLVELLSSSHMLGPSVESVLRFTKKYYGTISEVTKYFNSVYSIKTEPVCSRLEKLVKTVNTQVTPKVYPFINYVHEMEPKRNGKKGGAQSDIARIKKEGKLIPILIENIELYERYLIQLSKKSKSCDLTDTLKMSTNRDFRIDIEAIEKAFNEDESMEEEAEEDNEENGQNNDTTREENNNNNIVTRISSESSEDEDDGLTPRAKRQKTNALTNTPSRHVKLYTVSPKLF